MLLYLLELHVVSRRLTQTGISQSIARTEESLPVPERPQAGEDAYGTRVTTWYRTSSEIVMIHMKMDGPDGDKTKTEKKKSLPFSFRFFFVLAASD